MNHKAYGICITYYSVLINILEDDPSLPSELCPPRRSTRKTDGGRRTRRVSAGADPQNHDFTGET